MSIFTERIKINTKAELDIIDITSQVQAIVKKSGIAEGLCNVAVIGSTASISTLEYENGLVEDMKEYYERTIPSAEEYNHNRRWHDGNGHSHVRSSVTGTSQTFQIEKGALLLGTWQQIILMDFDNKQRNRNISVKVIGE